MRRTFSLVLFFLSLSASIAAADPQLTLLSPSGGSLTTGTETYITWTAREVNEPLRIVLRRNNVRVGVIAENVPFASGRFRWVVGQYIGGTAPAGGGYTIRIRRQSQSGDPARSDSPAPFTIALPVVQLGVVSVALPKLTLNHPNGGTLHLETLADIRWTAENISEPITLILEQEGRQVGVIASSHPPDPGHFQWRVGTLVGSKAPWGKGYKVRIRRAEVPDDPVGDASDSAFNIFYRNVNRQACEEHCAGRAGCRCRSDMDCGNGYRWAGAGGTYSSGPGATWYVCYLLDTKANCEAFCQASPECSHCSRQRHCGPGYENMADFTGDVWDENWHACRAQGPEGAEAELLAECEAYCSGEPACIRCSRDRDCGPGQTSLRRFESSSRYAPKIYACGPTNYRQASEENERECWEWCNTHRECLTCSPDFGCGGIGYRMIETFGGRGENWYACSRTAAQARRESNESMCRQWCATVAECTHCDSSSGCGSGSEDVARFGESGKWYGCADRGNFAENSAENQNLCNRWCATVEECHHCDSAVGCGSGYENFARFGSRNKWYGCKTR